MMKPNEGKSRKISEEQKERLTKPQEALEIAKQSCTKLFTDQHGTPYAAISVNGHIETIELGHSRFKNWVCKQFYETKQETLGDQDVSSVLNILKAEAEFHGERIELHVRVAGDGRDIIYYDLTDRDWQVVMITPDGWAIEDEPQILFVRHKNQIDQVRPSKTYSDDIFDRFFDLTNVKTEEDKLLLKCYIVACLVPGIPKPVLMLHGEQGSAKSTLQELIKMVIDPCSINSLSFSNDVNELTQKLSHNYFVSFDNVSHIKNWISDELCRAVTGGGNSKRRLYTDDDDVLYKIMRCIAVNGINLGADKSDLLDRGLIIQLQRIPKDRRRKVKDIWREFGEIKPELLGYIFDTLCKALRFQKEGGVELNELPRMADFAEIAEIISRTMGYPEGAFLSAYYKNIGMQTQEAIEANPVALCINLFMRDRSEWAGSTKELYEELEKIAEEQKINTARMEGWPKAPNALSRRLNEVKTNLRDIGIVIERIKDTTTNINIVQIRKISPESPEPSTTTILAKDTTGDIEDNKPESPRISPEPKQALSDDTGDTSDIIHYCPNGCNRAFATLEQVENHCREIHDL